MALAALALHAPGVAAGLLAGSPTLTAGAAASGTALALGAAASPYLGLKAGSLVMGGASYAASPVTAAASDIARVSASKLGIKAEQLGFGESALKQGLHGAGSASGFPEINTASAGQRPFVGSGEGGTSGGAASVKNFQEFKDRSKESASVVSDLSSSKEASEAKGSGQSAQENGKDSGVTSKNNSTAPAWTEQYFNADKSSGRSAEREPSRLSKVVNAYQVGSSVLERTAHPSGGVVVPIRPHED